MHETHVVDDLVKKIVQTAAQTGRAVKVFKVSIQLGALSQMSPSHFKEHFSIAAHGTIAENAQLEIEVSDDIRDPDAQRVLLKKIEVCDF